MDAYEEDGPANVQARELGVASTQERANMLHDGDCRVAEDSPIYEIEGTAENLVCTRVTYNLIFGASKCMWVHTPELTGALPRP